MILVPLFRFEVPNRLLQVVKELQIGGTSAGNSLQCAQACCAWHAATNLGGFDDKTAGNSQDHQPGGAAAMTGAAMTGAAYDRRGYAPPHAGAGAKRLRRRWPAAWHWRRCGARMVVSAQGCAPTAGILDVIAAEADFRRPPRHAGAQSGARQRLRRLAASKRPRRPATSWLRTRPSRPLRHQPERSSASG